MTEIIRNDLKEEQNTVAQQYKTNPKKFWKYVNSETKHIEKIGDLKKKDEHSNIVISNAAETKAEVLCEFFNSVFCIETDEKFEPIKDKICSYGCTPIIITEDDVLKRLNKLNVNKSEGPDLIHPRVIYEIRHELAQPLAMLFNRSLESNQIPAIWKCANIAPIYKKGRKDEVNNYIPVSLTLSLIHI